MFNFFDRISIKWKILIVVILPILISLFFSVNYLVNTNQSANKMDNIVELSKVAVASSEFIHELQKERGRSSGFLNSKGAKFSKEIKEQWLLTDKFLSNYKNSKTNLDISLVNISLQSNFTKIDILIQQLSSTRNSVSNFSTSTEDVIKYYTQTIHTIVAIVDDIAEVAGENPELSKMIASYKAFIELKERNGILRATLTGVFAKNSFNDFLYIKAIELGAEIKLFSDVFITKSNSEILDYYTTTVSGDDVNKSNELHKYALANKTKDSLGINPDVWFAAITNKIDLMKKVEDKMATDILVVASNNAESAKNNRNVFTISILAIMLFTLWLVYFISKRISNRLIIARNMALQIAAGNLSVLN